MILAGGDVSGDWFHVAPIAGAALVNVTSLDEGFCVINGAVHAGFSGAGRWGSQPVEFEVDVFDSALFGDEYEITISTPGGGTALYHADDSLARGDVSVALPG